MGLYDRLVLPGLLDLAMRNRRLAAYRHAVIDAARGRVLEIGVGSGLNLPLYGSAVNQVSGIDPSPELLERASKRIADAHVRVSLVRTAAEQLPFCQCRVRYPRDDLDALLDPGPKRRARRDAARPEIQRAVVIRRARPVARTSNNPLAASADAVLETNQRGVPPRPQDG